MNQPAILRREAARSNDGTFGTQQHTAPDTTLAELPDFRSNRARMMDDEIAGHKKRLAKMMEARRDEHLLDLARQLPANVTRVVFRVDYGRDGDKEWLMYDHADGTDDIDTADISKPLQDHLYGVAADFGAPGDFVADDWMAGEDDYYWVDLDEETALYHADSFDWEIKSEQERNGHASLRAAYGRDTWVERAIRVRAHQAGIGAINLHLPEEKAGVEVVSFSDRDGNPVAFDETNNDHRFIRAQAERFPHRTESMKPSGIAAHPIRLEV